MGCGSLDPAGAVVAAVYDRPALKRNEHHGLIAGSAPGFGAAEPEQLGEHGAVVIFVGG
jgi:hypothetical protein